MRAMLEKLDELAREVRAQREVLSRMVQRRTRPRAKTRAADERAAELAKWAEEQLASHPLSADQVVQIRRRLERARGSR